MDIEHFDDLGFLNVALPSSPTESDLTDDSFPSSPESSCFSPTPEIDDIKAEKDLSMYSLDVLGVDEELMNSFLPASLAVSTAKTVVPEPTADVKAAPIPFPTELQEVERKKAAALRRKARMQKRKLRREARKSKLGLPSKSKKDTSGATPANAKAQTKISKREERRMKNREAAMISRRRNQRKVQDLEDMVAHHKAENAKLLARVSELESNGKRNNANSIRTLPAPSCGSHSTAGAALMNYLPNCLSTESEVLANLSIMAAAA